MLFSGSGYYSYSYSSCLCMHIVWLYDLALIDLGNYAWCYAMLADDLCSWICLSKMNAKAMCILLFCISFSICFIMCLWMCIVRLYEFDMVDLEIMLCKQTICALKSVWILDLPLTRQWHIICRYVAKWFYSRICLSKSVLDDPKQINVYFLIVHIILDLF
jgi:hypothetical protein